jgi:aminopeptidase N
VFDDIQSAPIPSLLRGFSAPVKLKANYTENELIYIVKHDNDAFCRYDALIQLYRRAIQAKQLSDSTIDLLKHLLTNWQQDPELTALLLQLPTESDMVDMTETVDIESIHTVHHLLMNTIAKALHNELSDCYEQLLQTGPYDITPESMAKRALKNVCLQYLSTIDATIAFQQFSVANNMTDSLAALRALTNSLHPERQQALDSFYQEFQHDHIVLDKWFAIQATSNVPTVLDSIESLLQHPKFDIKNPNRVQALLGQFSRNNPYYFHEKNGRAYALYEKLILQLDKLNPQVASRTAQAFTVFKRFASPQRELMQKVLENLSQQKLSSDLYEIVNKSLKDL